MGTRGSSQGRTLRLGFITPLYRVTPIISGGRVVSLESYAICREKYLSGEKTSLRVRALMSAYAYNKSMIERLQWYWYETKRLHRLWVRPERSAYDLCRTVGIFWLWRHGAKREYKVKLWKTTPGWYALDLALPHKLLGVEADGAPHYTVNGFKHDILRDQQLRSKGWQILRVTYAEIKTNPRGVKKRVRKFLRG